MPPAATGRLPQARLWGASVLIGAAALLAASLAVSPASAPRGDLGAAYAALAAAPLGLDAHPVPTRILTPLASWLVGLRGEAIVWTVLLGCLALPVLAARRALGRGFGGGGALLCAGLLASTLVVRTSLHNGAYPDVITYLALCGVWARREHPRQASMLWLLAILDHERALLLGPWVAAALWLAAGGERRRRLWAWLGPSLAVGCWSVVYLWLISRRPAAYTALAYLEPLAVDPLHNLRGAGWLPLLGFWTALQWVWLVPAVWACGLLQRRRYRYLSVYAGLPLLAAALAMFLAYDWSRMATLAFPCLLPALSAAFRAGRPAASSRRLRVALAILLAAQALWPQTFTAAGAVEVWRGWCLPWSSGP